MNALGACSWNFLVLNARTFSSRHFWKQKRKQKLDQQLLLKLGMIPKECSGSVVECLTQDQGAAGWSLTSFFEQDTFILA